MILSSAVRNENLTNITWVVPIISTTKPNISTGNMSVFKKLVEYFRYNYQWNHLFRKGNLYIDGIGGVNIIEIKIVDIYDIIIIKATNSSDFINW